MSGGQSSGSDANNSLASFRQTSYGQASFVETSYGQESCGPFCNCGRSTTMLKSWTNENPGRRFYKCVVHGFVSWADAEKPHGWQKVSLLESRDEIRHYKEENKALKESLKALNHQQVEEIKIQKNSNHEEEIQQLKEEKKKLEEEKKKLEEEDMMAKEKEILLRQFIAISWGGFILAIAMIITISK